MPVPIISEPLNFLPVSIIEKVQAPASDMRKLNNLIDSLKNFHSNPEGICYIGQTLVLCDSFLTDNGIIREPLELCESLLDQMDSDPRIDEGLLDPRLSISKVNKLKRILKQFKDDILRF
jgi:hypothetical protein